MPQMIGQQGPLPGVWVGANEWNLVGAPNKQFVAGNLATDIGNTLATVQYDQRYVIKEYPGSGKISYAPKTGPTGTRFFEIPYYTYPQFIQAMSGYLTVTNGLPVYHLPDAFNSAYPYLFCRELEMEPLEDTILGFDLDPIVPRAWYTLAKVTCTYRPLDVEMAFSIAGKVIQLPGSGYSYIGNDIRSDVLAGVATLGQDVPRMLPNGEFSITRFRMLAPSFTVFTAMMGATNYSTWLGFPPTTLLMAGMDARFNYTLDGTPVWDVTFKMLYEPNSHQTLYNVAAQPPQFQFVRAINSPNGLANPNPPPAVPVLRGPSGEQVNQLANLYGVSVKDYGLIYPMCDFSPILLFL